MRTTIHVPLVSILILAALPLVTTACDGTTDPEPSKVFGTAVLLSAAFAGLALDPDNLELLRSVVVSSKYLPNPEFFPSLVGESPVLRIDAFGRTSISGWGSHSGIRTHTVEAF